MSQDGEVLDTIHVECPECSNKIGDDYFLQFVSIEGETVKGRCPICFACYEVQIDYKIEILD